MYTSWRAIATLILRYIYSCVVLGNANFQQDQMVQLENIDLFQSEWQYETNVWATLPFTILYCYILF